MKALQQMPPIKYDKPAIFTSDQVKQSIWTKLHAGDMVDCTIRKTILTNPPLDPDTCLLQLTQSSPQEEFLNLLLNGTISKTHSNWLQANSKKFTSLDFNRLLAKCEQQRVLSEISRIMKLDDLSKHATNSITT